MGRNYIKFYYNQNNYDNISYNYPNGTKATIKSGGCSICSTAMAINNLCGKELVSVKRVRDISVSSKARRNGTTILTTLLTSICKEYDNFSFKPTEYTNDLIKHLKNGGVAILHQGDRYNVFSSQGHYVYAYGIDENGNIKVADPANTESRYDKYPRNKRIVKKTKYGCVVKPEEVTKCTTPISYYLISYKGEYYGDIIKSPCKMFTCNATVKSLDIAFADNTRTKKLNEIKKGTRVKALGIGKTNTIIQYGINKNTYRTGIIYTQNIKFDK